MAKRQLLCCACKLAADIARQAPQLLLERTGVAPADSSSTRLMDVCAATTAVRATAGARSSAGQAAGGSTAGTSCRAATGCQLAVQLRLLLLSLGRRKLERSSSGQELLEAAEDALAALEQVVCGRSTCSASLCAGEAALLSLASNRHPAAYTAVAKHRSLEN
ncbi:hypothetical protein COO60DRAFT_1462336 [Scenedesmus sp. NREL 46B-D3]|nr:hypothetical protein COO60DRAFT_1462336 [Scenedesmus sp. NREL 46B-D3]